MTTRTHARTALFGLAIATSSLFISAPAIALADTPAVPVVTSPVSGTYTNVDTVHVVGTVDSNAAVVSVDGGAAPASTTPDSSGNFDVAVTLAHNAVNHLSVTASDAAFSTSSPADITVTHDDIAPVISNSSVTPDTGTLGVGDTLALTLATDCISCTAGTITINGQDVSGTFTQIGALFSGIYQVTYTVAAGDPNAAAGNIPLSASVKDQAGNESVATTTVFNPYTTSIVTHVATTTAPVIASIAGDNAIDATEAASAAIVGTAEASSTVNLVAADAAGTTVATTTTADGSGAWGVVLDLSGLSDGTITVSATSTAAGKTTSDTTTLTAVKDTVVHTHKRNDSNGPIVAAAVLPTTPANPKAIEHVAGVLGKQAYHFGTDLTVGSHGQDVVELQNVLIEQGFLNAGLNTGTFADLTKAAVIKYQKAHTIAPTSGFVGPLTRAELNKGDN